MDLQHLLEWASERGIRLDGVAPQRMPGKGIGIVATKALSADQIIFETPTSALRAMVPRGLAGSDLSVHGSLAFKLSLSPPSPWKSVCPTPDDMESSCPLAWPPALQRLLPGPGRRLLRAQQARFARDWAGARAQCEASFVDWRAYRHAWLLVNSRTFYDAKERMTLRPVADLFNHAPDDACAVSSDPKRFAVATRRAYRAGEEVCIGYGAHANDALLVEYGFVLDANPWDEVGLDDVVLPALSASCRRRLAAAGFLGGYVLDARDVCWRTQVAVRAVCLPEPEWRAFIDSGGDEAGAGQQAVVDRVLVGMLRKFRERTVPRNMRHLEALPSSVQKDLLVRRWRQIEHLVSKTMERLG